MTTRGTAMRKKSMIVSGLCAVALLGAGAGTAIAGEVTGNGDDTQGPSHANSICVFSGQNDEPDAPAPEGGRVQSYGQIVKAGDKSLVPSPGVACRGGSN
jgi:hypothetical protein